VTGGSALPPSRAPWQEAAVRTLPRPLALLAALLTACAPAIPTVRVERTEPPPVAGLPVIRPCLIEQDHGEKPLGLAVDGGEGAWPQIFSSFVLRHPREGIVLIEPGLGRDVRRDLAAAPPWFRLVMGEGETIRPISSELRRLGIPASSVQHALLTHGHWDHVGGLRDLPAARAHLAEAEQRFLRELRGVVDRGAMKRQLEREWGKLQPFSFDGPARWGFPATHDLFGDGTIVAVPLPGHTPGSTGYVVSSGDGARWLFVGDAAWVKEGIERPAHKGSPARALVDGDVGSTGETLARLHEISKLYPELKLVLSHDARTLHGIAPCEPPAR